MEQEQFSIHRQDLPKLFDPRDRTADVYTAQELRGIAPQEIDALARDVRLSIGRKCLGTGCGHVGNENGYYTFSGEAQDALLNVSGAVATVLAQPSALEFPKEKTERKAFVELLVDSAFHHEGKHTIYAPVCPDYSRGESFYKNLGEGISPEAVGAIRAAKILRGRYAEFLDPTVTILVADTEDDIPEIMQNVVGGERALYKARCEASVQSIQEQFPSHMASRIQVRTFSQQFGSLFSEEQARHEAYIREGMVKNPALNDQVQTIASTRVDRHSQILGRPEREGELTVRYMAQYMALGELLSHKDRAYVMNYPTPNRTYLNPAKNPFLPPGTRKTIPIVGTLVQR